MIRLLKKYLFRLYYRLRANYTTEHQIEMGLKVGRGFERKHDVILDPSHCWLISIGDNVTMAPRVHVLAHDASTKMFLNYTRIGIVEIGNNVFIGADSVILPNVRKGDNVIVGANSTVSKDLGSNAVYAGSPAKFICTIDSYLEKNRVFLESSPVFGESYHTQSISEDSKIKMKNELKDRHGYIV